MSFLTYLDLMTITEKLSPTIFHLFFYLIEQVMCHILATFEKHSPSVFHATIHLLNLADERSTAVVTEVFETQI